jgi:2-polyprenyl-3-methyl-5-hydroxy-6-metoxy-1,4-benzoquinol methylase
VSDQNDGAASVGGTANQAPSAVHEEALTILLRHARPGQRVLELGAGSGAFTRRMLAAGLVVEAVDRNPSEGRASEAPFHCVDLNASAWALPEAAYDVVIATELIEHLENPTQFLRNARHRLRPGGLLLLTTPNVVSLESRRRLLVSGRLARFDEDAWRSVGHLTPIPYWLLEIELRNVGFTVAERAFIGRQPLIFRPGRAWWKCLLVPWIDLALHLVARRIPVGAGLTTNVCYVAKAGS